MELAGRHFSAYRSSLKFTPGAVSCNRDISRWSSIQKLIFGKPIIHRLVDWCIPFLVQLLNGTLHTIVVILRLSFPITRLIQIIDQLQLWVTQSRTERFPTISNYFLCYHDLHSQQVLISRYFYSAKSIPRHFFIRSDNQNKSKYDHVIFTTKYSFF